MNGKPVLQVFIASTRPARVGGVVAQWLFARARAREAFTVEPVDLAELDLPLMNEPHHRRLRRYEHRHTKEWSARVDAADAFVFVMPEYNHGFTAPLKNAIDYLVWEWAYKPVGFVSYGGVAAGTRAIQMLKPVLIALRMTPVVEAVNIPFVKERIIAGELLASDEMNSAALAMLDELERVEEALRLLRNGVRARV